MVSYGMKMINREAVDVQMRMGFGEKISADCFTKANKGLIILKLNLNFNNL